MSSSETLRSSHIPSSATVTLETLNSPAHLSSDSNPRPFGSPQNWDQSAFSRLILRRSPAEDLARFWSSSSRHGGLRCVTAAGGESRASREPPPPPQIVVLVMVATAVVAMGDGGCLSDPSPLVLSPALLIHTAARHCGNEGGRVERTAVNEFRRNRDSPLSSLFSFCFPTASPSFLMDVCHVQRCLRNVGLSWSIMAKYSFCLTHTHTHARKHMHARMHTHSHTQSPWNDTYTPIRRWHCTH